MNVVFSTTERHNVDIPDAQLKTIAADFLRQHFGFMARGYDSAGKFVDGDILCEGYWVCGHNRDWETKELRAATEMEMHAWSVIEHLEDKD